MAARSETGQAAAALVARKGLTMDENEQHLVAIPFFFFFEFPLTFLLPSAKNILACTE